MNTISLLGSVLGLSFTSGINLYATVLTVGLAIRNGWVTEYPAGLEILSNDWVIGIALVFYTCEFVADKVPAFDTFWDAVHTFIRPVAGAGIAFAAASEARPEFVLVAALAGGGVAATTHIAKAGTRLIINTSPEPVSNWVVSFLEDIGAFSLAYLAMAHPYIALVVTVVLLAAIYYVLPILFRFVCFAVTAVVTRIAAFFYEREQMDFLPGDHLAVVGTVTPPELAVEAFARRCGKAGSNRRGFLSVDDGHLTFTYNRWFRVWMERIERSSIHLARLNRGLLCDVLEIITHDGRVIRFLFTRTRGPLVARLAAELDQAQDPAGAAPLARAQPDTGTPAS